MTKIHLKNTNFFPPKQTKISPPNYKIPLEHKFRFLCDDFEFSRFKFFLDGFVFISVFFCIFQGENRWDIFEFFREIFVFPRGDFNIILLKIKKVCFERGYFLFCSSNTCLSVSFHVSNDAWCKFRSTLCLYVFFSDGQFAIVDASNGILTVYTISVLSFLLRNTIKQSSKRGCHQLHIG